jgi:hypothetical protein
MKALKTRYPPLAAAALLIAASPAWSGIFIHESDIGQWCLGGHTTYTAACEGYASATYDRIWATGKFYDGTLACPPKGLTPIDLKDTVAAFLMKRPLPMGEGSPATLLILEALKEKWPCGIGVNTGSMVKMETFLSKCSSGTEADESWCTGFVAGSTDAASVIAETGETSLLPVSHALMNLTWGEIYETVKRYVLYIDIEDFHPMPYGIIEVAITDADEVSE